MQSIISLTIPVQLFMWYNKMVINMTKYEYLAQLLEQDIINHKYKRGEKLPSIQTLSNNITAAKKQ